jgi:hypothetical protein
MYVIEREPDRPKPAIDQSGIQVQGARILFGTVCISLFDINKQAKRHV